MTCREHALGYAAREWPVFPTHSAADGRCTCGNEGCDNVGKHPRTAHGLKDATTDPSIIEEWWRRWPDANVAVVTGSRSGLTVLDVDRKHGGHATLASLVATHGPLPDTVQGATGGGGDHYVFRYTTPLKNRVGFAKGLDIRCDGGYVVVPPSIHVSKLAYAWVKGRAPGELELAAMPDWLIALAQSKKKRGEKPLAQRAAAYMKRVPPADEGGRNAAAFSAAGHLHALAESNGIHLTEAEVLEALRPWNARCSPPLGEDELAACVASAKVNGTPPPDKPPQIDPCDEPAAPGVTSESGVTVRHIVRGRQGKVQVSVTWPNGGIFADRFDVSDAEGRAKFVSMLVEKKRDIDLKFIESELDEITNEVMGRMMEGELDAEAPDGQVGDPDGGDSQMLVELATANCTLFHEGSQHDAVAYAQVKFDDHVETWPVKSTAFGFWLRRRFYEMCKRPPSAQGFTDALAVIASIAVFDGQSRTVALRVAEHEGVIYLDLGDAKWRVVRIDATGWSVISNLDCPVLFIRRRGMLALPDPVAGGSIDELRPFTNCATEDLWTLYAGSLVVLFRPRGPYFVFVYAGEQGSGKTSQVRRTRALIDPNKAALRRLPRDDRDLAIAAKNAFVQAFDNLSHIRASVSDALCSLSTGGGFATRELYSDDEEALFDAMRPVFLNGIEDVATRGDLLDRAIIFHLAPMPESNRREDAELEQEFERKRPRILGAILTAVSTAIRRFPEVELKRKPRMIDCARWCQAAEVAYGWSEGTFIDAFLRNQSDATAIAMESSPIGSVVLKFMEGRDAWDGTSGELLEALEDAADEKTKGRKEWPKTPKAVSDELRRIAPSLRKLGVDYIKPEKRGAGGKRTFALRTIGVGTNAAADAGRSRDDGHPDNRPKKNATGDTAEASRDGGDGRDAAVPGSTNDGGEITARPITQSPTASLEPSTDTTVPSVPAALITDELWWLRPQHVAVVGVAGFGTVPSVTTVPTPVGDSAKADFQGRSSDGGTVAPAGDRPDDGWEVA